MNRHRRHSTAPEQETWEALAELLALSTPAFDAALALRGIERRLRQRRVRRAVAAGIAILLPCSVMAAMYVGQLAGPRQVAAVQEANLVGLAAQSAEPVVQPCGQVPRHGSHSHPRAASCNHLGRNELEAIGERQATPPLAPDLLWDDDWELQLAETRGMLLSVQHAWHRPPDHAALLKRKLDGLETDLADSTL